MDFVDFDLAKKLKEKGFDKECFGWYYPAEVCGFDYKTTIVFNNSAYRGSNYKDILVSHTNEKYIDAPTISQVLDWFRKKHHLHFEVVGAAYGYNLIISDTPDKGGTDRYYSHANDDGPNYAGAWDDYDDCVLHGIEYALNNLI